MLSSQIGVSDEENARTEISNICEWYSYILSGLTLPENRLMTPNVFITDSLSIAKATPKRRHVDLRVSLTAALNEFVSLGLFESYLDSEGLNTWSLVGGSVVAQEAFYEDSFKRQFVFTQLTRDAALGVLLRARHPGDRAAIAQAIQKADQQKNAARSSV